MLKFKWNTCNANIWIFVRNICLIKKIKYVFLTSCTKKKIFRYKNGNVYSWKKSGSSGGLFIMRSRDSVTKSDVIELSDFLSDLFYLKFYMDILSFEILKVKLIINIYTYLCIVNLYLFCVYLHCVYFLDVYIVFCI